MISDEHMSAVTDDFNQQQQRQQQTAKWHQTSEYLLKTLKTLGKKAQRDFEELLDCCNVAEKIEFVDAPKGHDNKEHCGVFKNVHVEQWTTNMEGDSYAGFIYANVSGKWIKVPFSC